MFICKECRWYNDGICSITNKEAFVCNLNTTHIIWFCCNVCEHAVPHNKGKFICRLNNKINCSSYFCHKFSQHY